MKLEQWLLRRAPEVPEAFLPFLQADSQDDVTADSLLARGMDKLEEALLTPGRTREAAFPLLAADAWLTYACEEAAEGEGFSSVCHDILTTLGKRFAS